MAGERLRRRVLLNRVHRLVDMVENRRTIGGRIKRLRKARGMSQRALASRVKVDATAVAAWEADKYLPGSKNRLGLAHALGVDPATLFNDDAARDTQMAVAAVFDTAAEMPTLLMNLTKNVRQKLRALRLAAPYSTTPTIQTEWRQLVSERLLAKTLEVQRAEIFYELPRVQEILANILRYDGCAYWVKAYCSGVGEVVPAMGGYFFDEDEYLLGAYWTQIPPSSRLLSLRLSGDPFRDFFEAYWDSIWQRGLALNIHGARDLSAIQSLAFQLGLPRRSWKAFVDEAAELEIGDGAPPLI